MGLFNIVLGTAPDTDALMALLQAKQSFTGFVRLRSAWVEHDGDKLLVRVHTRSGGGNRECWCDDHESESDDCIAAGNESLMSHPWYVRDEDDDFDSTYADFYFAPPFDELPKEVALALVEAAQPPVDVGDLWRQAIAALAEPREESER